MSLKSVSADRPSGLGSVAHVRQGNRFAEPTHQLIARVDVLVLLFFALLALMHHAGRSGGAYPFPSDPPLGDFVYLGGDAANIASFAAALDHPDLFGRDELLGNPQNFRVYSTVHIPALRLLAKVTGSYGKAFVSTLGLHVFLQAVGFYVLGRVIFGSRYWAALLALVTLMRVDLNLGEYWGIYDDPQPRFSFQALLPFLLAAAFYWRSRPAAWPWVMAAAAALVYVHPVSAPAWGLAVWCGLWACHPPEWSPRKGAFSMVVLGAVFLVVASPFAVHYLRSFQHGNPAGGVKYAKIIEIMAFRFETGFLDLPRALRHFIGLWREKWFYWAWAVAGVAVLLSRPEERRKASLVVLWCVGLLLTSVALPLSDHAISRVFKRLPFELDLIRGIRYTVPLMLLFCLWPLAVATRTILSGSGARRFARAAVYAGGILLATVWIQWFPPAAIAHSMSCWAERRFVCAWPEPEQGWWPNVSHLSEALTAVRQQTESGAAIHATDYDYGLAIRYETHRAVVYEWKDGGIFAYANHAALLRWYDRHLKLKAIGKQQNGEAEIRDLVNFSTSLGAKYLLIEIAAQRELDFRRSPAVAASSGADLLWSNNSFALLRVHDKSAN